MVKVITGREGCGKTEKIIHLMAAGKDSVLIVPEQYSHETERLLCQIGGDSVSQRAEVLSFTRLANRVFSEAGGLAVQYLDGCGRLLAMKLALNMAAPKLRIFSRAAGAADYLDSMLTVIDELKAYCVTPEQLETAAEKATEPLETKLRELALILETYDGVTAQYSADPNEKMTMLGEKLGECSYAENKDFYIDCFSDFTKLELNVIQELILQGRSVTFAITYDDDGNYTLQGKTIRHLEALAKRCGKPFTVEAMEAKNKKATELSWMDRGLLNHDTPAYDGKCKAVKIFASQNIEMECDWAAAACKKLVSEGDLRWRDITIAVTDVTEYGERLQRSFEKQNIPIFVSIKRDINSLPGALAINSALSAVTGGYEADEVFTFVKSGFSGLTEDERDRLENYAILWNLRGRQLLKPFTNDPRGYGHEPDEASELELAELEEIRERIFEPLERLETGLKKAENGAEMVETLYAFLEELAVAETLEELYVNLIDKEPQRAEELSQLWELIINVLEQCHEMLEQLRPEPAEFAKLIRLALGSGEVGSIPVYYDAVSVNDISGLRHRSPKVLIVLGANDSKLPSAIASTGIITEGERAAIKELGIELAATAGEKLEEEMETIHSCLCSAGEELLVSYCLESSGGEEMRPSFVIYRLNSLFPDIFTARVGDDDLIWSEKQLLLNSLINAERFELNARQKNYVNQILDKSRIVISDISKDSAAALYGKRLRLSATRIDSFNSCHYRYFLQYGLKAQERQQVQFSAPEYGTFMHYVLENVCKEAMNAGGFSTYDRALLPELLDMLIENYVNQMLGGMENKTARFTYLFNRLKKTVRAVVNNIFDELSCSDFQPLDFELSFGGDFAPVTVMTGSDSGAVSGKVDRVDGYVKDGKMYLRVVDYKTGKKPFDFTSIRYGINLQMLIYLFALKNGGEQRYKMPVVPAGVLYLPARDEVLSASRYITDEQLKKEKEKTLVRSGLLLDDSEILDAMEHLSEGENPRFMPFKLNKDGEAIGSALASAERLGKLSGYVDKTLCKLVSEMAGGGASPTPYVHGTNSSCQYCEFEQACSCDTYRKWKTYSAEDFWKELENG